MPRIRRAMGGRGKRGGERLIYFYARRTEKVYLLYVYPKNQAVDLNRRRAENAARCDLAAQPGGVTMSQRARAHAARLIASAEEALDIARGKQVPTRAYTARDVLVEAPPAYTAGQIREIRDAIRVSQQVFAQMLNVSDKTVHAWEQGARVPDGPTLRLLELAQHDPEALLRRVIGRRDRGSAADLRRGQRVPGEPRSRTGRSEGARKSARKGR